MNTSKISVILVMAFITAMPAWAQRLRPPQDSNEIIHLSEIYMRDVYILPDAASKTYYMIGPGRAGTACACIPVRTLEPGKGRVLSARLHEIIHSHWYRQLCPAISA